MGGTNGFSLNCSSMGVELRKDGLENGCIFCDVKLRGGRMLCIIMLERSRG